MRCQNTNLEIYASVTVCTRSIMLGFPMGERHPSKQTLRTRDGRAIYTARVTCRLTERANGHKGVQGAVVSLSRTGWALLLMGFSLLSKYLRYPFVNLHFSKMGMDVQFDHCIDRSNTIVTFRLAPVPLFTPCNCPALH